MNQQLYYQLQAKMQLLESLGTQFFNTLDDARDLFAQIDPNQLGGAVQPGPLPTPPAQTGTSTTFPPPSLQPPAQVPVPVPNPKQRVRLNAPILTGVVKDAVEDAIAYKQAALDEAARPKRIAPYEVVITDVKYRDYANDFWANVYDKKYDMTAMVPIGKDTFEEFNRDPDGLLLELDSTTLDKTEWFPVKEPTDNAATTVAAPTEV